MPRPFYLRLDNHPDSVSSRHCRINKFLPAPPEPLTPESHRSAMFRISLLGESYSSERGEPTLTSPDPDAFGADAPRRRYLTPALGALLYTLGEDFQSYLLTRPDLLKMMGDGARIFLFMGIGSPNLPGAGVLDLWLPDPHEPSLPRALRQELYVLFSAALPIDSPAVPRTHPGRCLISGLKTDLKRVPIIPWDVTTQPAGWTLITAVLPMLSVLLGTELTNDFALALSDRAPGAAERQDAWNRIPLSGDYLRGVFAQSLLGLRPVAVEQICNRDGRTSTFHITVAAYWLPTDFGLGGELNTGGLVAWHPDTGEMVQDGDEFTLVTRGYVAARRMHAALAVRWTAAVMMLHIGSNGQEPEQYDIDSMPHRFL